MTKIILIWEDSPWAISATASFPPLGVLYIAADLKRAGHNVQVFDQTGVCEGKERPLTSDMIPEDVDIIGYSATTPHFPLAVARMRNLKTYFPDAIHLIGGPHATCHPKSCLKAGFDTVIRYEGEIAMTTLAACVDDARDPLALYFGMNPDDSHCLKSSCEESGGGPCRIMNGPFVHNLDQLPWPDRDMVNISKYDYMRDGKKCGHVMASRGCPYHCSFCSKTFSQQVRYRRAEDVVQEAIHLKSQYRYGVIFFHDDIFGVDLRWLRTFCGAVRSTNLNWRVLGRANIFDEQRASMMADNGCTDIAFGFESGSQRILDVIQKGTTPSVNLEAARIAHEHGLKVRALMIIGLPSESRETVEETRKWLHEAEPFLDSLDLTIYVPYPLSDIWDNYGTGKYDIRFDFDPETFDFTDPKKFVYKQSGHYSGPCSTSSLSAEEIARLRMELVEEFGDLMWERQLQKR